MNWKEGLRRIAWVLGLLGFVLGLTICAFNLDQIRSSFELITGGPIYEITTQKEMREEDRSNLEKIVIEMEKRQATQEAIQAKVDAYKRERTPLEVTQVQSARIKQDASGQWVSKTTEEIASDKLAGYKSIALFALFPLLGFAAPFLLLWLVTWVVGGFRLSA